jgi:hypothetical protein
MHIQPDLFFDGRCEEVMYACFRVGDTQVMASDGHCPRTEV